MQDETPDGQPQHVGQGQGGGQGGDPGSAWWPWPEPHADGEAPGHRDGAPGGDETLTLPMEEPAVEFVAASEPVPEEPVLEPIAEELPVTEDVVLAVADPAPELMPDPDPVLTPAGAGESIVATAPAVTSEPAMAAGVENPAVPRDYEPPVEGVDKVGSIPAVAASHAWAKGQWSNWRLFLVRFVSAGVSVVLAVALVPGLSFTSWRWGEGLEIALIFALLNAFVKPMLQFVALRFLFSSYGIVIVLINTLLLMLLARVLNDSIQFESLFALLVGGALVGLIGGAMDAMLGANYPLLDRDYKERNDLT